MGEGTSHDIMTSLSAPEPACYRALNPTLAENVYRLHVGLMEILSVCLDEIGLSGLEGKWKMTITFMAWVGMSFSQWLRSN